MQGVFVDGQRPKSKKAVKEAMQDDPRRVDIQATSMFGNEYGGPASAMPEGEPVYFVGPDPYTKRNFYGTITRKGEKISVK